MSDSPYKMKGHSLPGIKQRPAPAKHRVSSLKGMDDKGIASATAHNDAHASGKDPHSSSKKSPAKCPFLAALPAITGAIGAVGAMKKKKEE